MGKDNRSTAQPIPEVTIIEEVEGQPTRVTTGAGVVHHFRSSAEVHWHIDAEGVTWRTTLGSRPEAEIVKAAADVLRAWRLSPMGAPISIEQLAPDLAHALQALSAQWPS
jgi:hypothetical protein